MAKSGPIYIHEIIVNWNRVENPRVYPYSLPLVKSLKKIKIDTPVTFIVGENGSGKSTLIEAIAVAGGFNPEGGSKNFSFSTRSSHSNLSDVLTLVRGVARPKDGFFLRAESFFTVASEIERLDIDEGDFPNGPKIIDSYGGVSLHEQSHGESFFALITHRFRGKGLYILDEPEAALSPMRQLAMLRRIHDLVSADSQFIIATHSPILLTIPGATILQVVNNGLKRVTYEETEHYQVAKAFLEHPDRMLKILLDD
jgi:predicted ATPase